MIIFKCFEGIPFEFESFLIQKYDSYITTCRYIEIYYPSYHINYILVYNDNHLIELFIFGNKGKTCTSFNSLVNIDQHIVKEFTNIIFDKFPTIKTIKIAASYKSYNLNKSFLISKDNDFILKLPSTIDTYYSELGSNTRKHTKYYKIRLLKDYPTVKYITKFGIEIDEIVIDKIIQLSYDRMKSKGLIPGKNHSDTTNFYKYSQHYGCVTYIEIDGVIIAGSISYILNKRIFIYMIAHDNNFSKYNPGQLCIIYLIQISIEKQLSSFHFLWGENEYKIRLLAKPHSLFTYIIYRTSSFDFIFNKVKAMLKRTLNRLRLSKYSMPLRTVIKYFRRTYLQK